MKNHINNLIKLVPDLLSRRILDLGSGKGKFLIELKKIGADALGIEPTEEYINISLESAKKEGIEIKVIKGVAENIPIENSSIGFVNIGEVIEHVEDPEILLSEVYGVLQPQGKAYLSIPNRFGLKDQHFHLYFINWMPRRLAHFIIGLLGKHKDYSGINGRQSLIEMHYFTYSKIKKLCIDNGFIVEDIRIKKINKKFEGARLILVTFAYKLLRTFYWDSFHLLLTKS